MATKHRILAVILVASALTLAAVFVFYPRDTNLAERCTGPATWRGVVVDRSGEGLGGVVVRLTSEGHRWPASVLTEANGSWSADLVANCAYRAALFWQSEERGPLLAENVSVTPGATLSVPLSRARVTLPFLAEFPNDPTISVSPGIREGFWFEIAANHSGGAETGFLAHLATGRAGTVIQVSQPLDTPLSSPFVLAYEGALAYEIVDVHGEWLVYAEETPTGRFTTIPTEESITMALGIQLAYAEGSYPFVQMAGSHDSSYWFRFQNPTDLPLERRPTAFGRDLSTGLHVPGVADNHVVPVTIRNNEDGARCWVWYRDGMEQHVWYYGSGSCPP